jgi:hypothetical protein
VREDLAGDITLEAPHDLSLGLAFGGAAGDVVLGRLVAAHADQGDAPQGAVGLPIAAAVQPVPVGTPGRNRDRGSAAQPGEGRLRAQAFPVVPGVGSDREPGRIGPGLRALAQTSDLSP